MAEVLHYALSVDGIYVHKSMNSHTNTIEETNAKYDTVSYQKGKYTQNVQNLRNFEYFFDYTFIKHFFIPAASIFRMVSHVVTRSIFRKGLSEYLRTG